MKPIPYGKHSITAEDIDAVVEVLKGDFLTQGPAITLFEKAFAEYIGSDYAIAVANGTAALHLSALALGVKAGDKVITTPISFAATANCIEYAGGEVFFCDIDPETYLLDLKKVEALLLSYPRGTFSGIIPVDFAGRAVNLVDFRKIADKYGCWLLEDSCHAPGGYISGKSEKKRKCGDGQSANLAIFSFHPVKHIAAGEGGMITTNDPCLYKKLQLLRSHGITKDPLMMKENHGGWYYEMQALGYNYRLTDIQATLGHSQLLRATEGLERRKDIARRYRDAFDGKSFIKRQVGFVDGHAYHLYVIEVENRKGLYDYLQEKNIYAQIHYIPIHMMPYYKEQGLKKGDFPQAEKYYDHCISLPIFPTLENEDQMMVIRTILDFYA
jgi:UDP-4-amino-4,6-dideoxy-N-acetyl-beta-L-altrosamine transaminase